MDSYDEKPKIFRMNDKQVTLSDIDEDQAYIMQRFSRTVREVLTTVEGVIPDTDSRFRAIRRQINQSLYDTRNDMLVYFTGDESTDDET